MNLKSIISINHKNNNKMATIQLNKRGIRRTTLQQKLTMKGMYDEGYTLASIAEYTGKSLSTVKRVVYDW